MGVAQRMHAVVNSALAPLGIGVYRVAGDARFETRATLEITTVVGCPLACDFCPQGLLRSRYPKDAVRELSLADFKTALSTVPKDVCIDFSGMSEPWAARDATAMLRHALERGYTVSVYTTLVGMSDDDVAFLVEHMGHFGRENPFCLHLPDDEGLMAGFRPSDEYRARVIKVLSAMRRAARRRPAARGGLQLMTMSPAGKVHESIADLVPVPLERFTSLSRAGNIAKEKAIQVRHYYPVECRDADYHRNVMLPNGDVIVCCMDYGLTTNLGNLLTQPYESLSQSEGMRCLTHANLCDGFDESAICKSCEWAVRAGTHG